MSIDEPGAGVIFDMLKHSLIAASLSVSVLFSVAAPALSDDKKDDLINSNAILWRMEKEGSIKNYLFGTMHVPDRAVIQIPAEVRKAFNGSSQAAFEIVNEMKPKLAFTSSALMNDGRSLKEVLDPETYEQVITMAKEVKGRERDVFLLKPWAAAFMVGGTKEQRALLRAGRPRLDDYLMQEAMRIGMKLEPLERPGERVYGWDFIPEEDQIKLLKHALATYKDSEKRSEAMVKMYLERDVVGIINESKKFFAVMGEESAELIWQEFLIKRNERMLDAAIPLMEGGGVFIAVGLAHLPGEGGMVQLFEQEGFKITPVY